MEHFTIQIGNQCEKKPPKKNKSAKTKPDETNKVEKRHTKKIKHDIKK